jgi:hypothetical protein
MFSSAIASRVNDRVVSTNKAVISKPVVTVSKVVAPVPKSGKK